MRTELPVASYELPVASYELPVASYELPAGPDTDYGLRVTDF